MLQLIHALPAPWADAVVASLLGDAFGVPHEFKWGHEIPPIENLHMEMPAGYPKSYAGVPYGTWSDDGSQLLALLCVLDESEGVFRSGAFIQALQSWYHEGWCQAGGVVFDCGGQTRAALSAHAAGRLPDTDEHFCGNGSLMRVLPVASLPDWFGLPRNEAIRIAMAQSEVTHPQALPRVCCALYVELCWLVRKGPVATGEQGMRLLMSDAVRALLSRDILNNEELSALSKVVAFGGRHMLNNSGFVVDTLWSALWALVQANTLSDTLRRAVSLGNDTDTVACLAGGLGYLAYGWDTTALAWRRQLVGVS